MSETGKLAARYSQSPGSERKTAGIIDHENQSMKLSPRAKHVVLGKLETADFWNESRLVSVEPAHLPFEGVQAAHVVAQTMKPSAQTLRSRSTSAVTSQTIR
jgi:hypothetical protein